MGDKGLNCLINNAGINVLASLEEVTAETMLTIYETNTVAQLMVTKVRIGRNVLNRWWSKTLLKRLISSCTPREKREILFIRDLSLYLNPSGMRSLQWLAGAGGWAEETEGPCYFQLADVARSACLGSRRSGRIVLQFFPEQNRRVRLALNGPAAICPR